MLLGKFHPTITNENKLDLLERISWCLADDGSELFDIRRGWLESDKRDLVDLALMRWSVLLANDRASAEKLLEPLRHLPEYQERIDARLSDIDRMTGNQPDL